MSCTNFQSALDQWDPASDVDLSDDVARHIDGCASCQARFDARFEPSELDDVDVPEDLTLLMPAPVPANTSRRFAAGIVVFSGLGALAAAALTMVMVGTAVMAPVGEDIAVVTEPRTAVGDTGGQIMSARPVAKNNTDARFRPAGAPSSGEGARVGGSYGVKADPHSSPTSGLSNRGRGSDIVGGETRSSGDRLGRGGNKALEEKPRVRRPKPKAGTSGPNLIIIEGGRETKWTYNSGGVTSVGGQGGGTAGTGTAGESTGYFGMPDLGDAKQRDNVAEFSQRRGDRDGDLARPLGVLSVAEPPSTGEEYDHPGVNPVVFTADDPQSTFSIDVDTGAYVVTRRKLRAGHLPPQASVRPEEFINYFPYEYSQPRAGDPFAVDFEAAPSPWTRGKHIVRIGVQGKRVAYDERKPVHLTFLVDTSGSMRSKDNLEILVDELEDGDTVALVTYAGSSTIQLPVTPVSNRAAILRAIRTLSSGGSTAMASGISTAYELAEESYAEGAVNRVIICSDGDANVGQTRTGSLVDSIRSYADRGIALTTVGVGTGNYKDARMEQLANQGDGQYIYIDGEREARRVFADKLTSTLEVIARDVKLQVAWRPEAVRSYRLIGYENRDIADVDFRNDAVDAGEVGAGHQVTALYEVELASGYYGPLGVMHVRSKAPGPDAPAAERSYPMRFEHMRPTLSEASTDFRVALAASAFAEKLRGSLDAPWGEIHAIAKSAARVEYREDRELVELIARAWDLAPSSSVQRR
jgi:Ca-activated chloride channel family protein